MFNFLKHILKYSFYTLLFLVGPWLLFYLALFTRNLLLSPRAEHFISVLESIHNSDLFLLIGVAISVLVLVYWKNLFHWFVVKKVETSWSNEEINRVASLSHIVLATALSAHFIFVLWA